jgi:hypothetical protein
VTPVAGAIFLSGLTMSYSFNVRAATKAEAKLKVAAELDKVVQQQPVHTTDRDQAMTVATAFVDMLADAGENQDIVVSVNGWLSWSGETPVGTGFSGSCVGVSASVAAKLAA